MDPLPIFGSVVPAEVALQFLSRMTVKHLGVCARVCKSWKSYAYSDLLWKHNGVLDANSRADFLEKMQKVFVFSKMMFADQQNPLCFDTSTAKRIACSHLLNFGYVDSIRLGECAPTPQVSINRMAKESPIKDISALVNYLAASLFYFSEEEINTTLSKYHTNCPLTDKEKRVLLILGVNFFPKHFTDGVENVRRRVSPTVSPELLSLLKEGQFTLKDKTIRLTTGTRTQNVATLHIRREMQCTISDLTSTNWPQEQKDLFPIFFAYCSRYTFKYGYLSLHQYCWEALKTAETLNEGIKILTATPKFV